MSIGTIVLGGLPASGKSTTARIIEESVPTIVLNVGDLLRSRVPSSDHRSEVGRAFLSQFHVAHIGDIIAEELMGLDCRDKFVVIDAVRFKSVCEQLRETAKPAEVWYVTTNEAVRVARLTSRYRGQPRAASQQRVAEYSEFDTSAAEVLEVSDRVLDNDGSIEDLRISVLRSLSLPSPNH
jgi:dephospho-CoA kinase